MPTPICTALFDTLSPVPARCGDLLAWRDDGDVVVYDGETAALIRTARATRERMHEALEHGLIAPASQEHAVLLTDRLHGAQRRAG
jgi:hypothetical protein